MSDESNDLICKVRLALQHAVPKKLIFHFSASSVSSGDPPAFVGNSSFSLMGRCHCDF